MQEQEGWETESLTSYPSGMFYFLILWKIELLLLDCVSAVSDIGQTEGWFPLQNSVTHSFQFPNGRNTYIKFIIFYWIRLANLSKTPQKLHPHISSWGSLLRLYGNRSMQTMREKKAEEQEITLLQSNATVNQPNTSIINKLKLEMLKLQEMKVRQSASEPNGWYVCENNPLCTL